MPETQTKHGPNPPHSRLGTSCGLLWFKTRGIAWYCRPVHSSQRPLLRTTSDSPPHAVLALYYQCKQRQHGKHGHGGSGGWKYSGGEARSAQRALGLAGCGFIGFRSYCSGIAMIAIAVKQKMTRSIIASRVTSLTLASIATRYRVTCAGSMSPQHVANQRTRSQLHSSLDHNCQPLSRSREIKKKSAFNQRHCQVQKEREQLMNAFNQWHRQIY